MPRLPSAPTRRPWRRPWPRQTAWAAPLLLFVPTGRAQGVLGAEAAQEVHGIGWAGFLDVGFLVHAVLVLALATALGAAIAYHPRSLKQIDTVDESEAPKGYMLYAVVGAVIGLMVVQFGLVVGFVIFGIGGLFRFRTTLPSLPHTGRLILVTLVGLACGLDLPHLGVLATAFGFTLIYVLDRTITFHVEIQGLEAADLAEASVAYRALIEAHGAVVIREKRGFAKAQLSFIFRAPYRFDREALDEAFKEQIPPALRGTVDWEVS